MLYVLFQPYSTHVLVAFSAFGGILFGYDTGVISGVKEMVPWLRTFGQLGADGKYFVTSSQESLVVSILSAGTFFGALLGAPVGDYIGRKWVRALLPDYSGTDLIIHRVSFLPMLFSVLVSRCKLGPRTFLSL